MGIGRLLPYCRGDSLLGCHVFGEGRMKDIFLSKKQACRGSFRNGFCLMPGMEQIACINRMIEKIFQIWFCFPVFILLFLLFGDTVLYY